MTNSPHPVCADCGASETTWASLNHGVLICADCCFVHRNLGRHISQIRSLTKGIWHDKQLALIHFLYANGSNNVWEHALIDPQSGGVRSKKKPVSNDPRIPKKEAFITAKYSQLAYVIRPAKDEFSLDDLNRQLWSCVRTCHVETALRLLALGACPNYADRDKANTPLHIAAKDGQDLQVELLWIYGADVGQRNAAGQRAAELARQAGHIELADRLIELEYEVSDRFSIFLCGRRPNHRENQHFMIPELIDSGRSAHVRQFRQLIQQSGGTILERMIQDVYDEVDRRELNSEWAADQPRRHGSHQHVAIFLPPNSRLSATRNQLRQKLAKFSTSDFTHLLIDLLKEIRRRHLGFSLYSIDEGVDSPRRLTSDELNQRHKSCTSSNSANGLRNSSVNKSAVMDDSAIALLSLDNYLELKEKWTETSEKLEQYAQTNGQILKTLQQLQKAVQQLQLDQAEMRHDLDTPQKQHRQYGVASPPPSLATAGSNNNFLRQSTPPLHQNSVLAVNQPQVGAVVMSTSTLVRNAQNKPTTNIHQYSTDTFPSTKMSTRLHAANNPVGQPQISSTSVAALQTSQPPKLGLQHRQNSLGSAMAAVNQQEHSSAGGHHSSLEKSHSAAYPPPSLRNATQRKNSAHAIAVNSNVVTHRDVCGSAPPSSGLAEKEALNVCQNGDPNPPAASVDKIELIFNDQVFPDNLILETKLLTNAINALLQDLKDSGSNSGTTNPLFHADSINHHIVRILGVIPDSYMRAGVVQNCAMGMETAMKQLSRQCLARPFCPEGTSSAAQDVAWAAKELLVAVHGLEERNN